jgi:hypothetical protein
MHAPVMPELVMRAVFHGVVVTYVSADSKSNTYTIQLAHTYLPFCARVTLNYQLSIPEDSADAGGCSEAEQASAGGRHAGSASGAEP